MPNGVGVVVIRAAEPLLALIEVVIMGETADGTGRTAPDEVLKYLVVRVCEVVLALGLVGAFGLELGKRPSEVVSGAVEVD